MGVLWRPFVALFRAVASLFRTLRNAALLVTAAVMLLFVLDRLLLDEPEGVELDDLEI